MTATVLKFRMIPNWRAVNRRPWQIDASRASSCRLFQARRGAMVSGGAREVGEMQFAKLRLVLPLIVCVLASSDADQVQETGQEGIFYGRGSSGLLSLAPAG